MKKAIVSIILSLIVATVAAQTNHYPNTSGTITKSGYTYKYRNLIVGAIKSDRQIQLYNSNVSYLDEEIANRDGTPIDWKAGIAGTLPSSYSGQSMNKEQVIAMIRGIFTSAQKAALIGDFLWVEAFVDTSTGKVSDVLFAFRKDQSYMNIPVETYRAIELAIKQKFTVTITAEGRKRNYVRFAWGADF